MTTNLLPLINRVIPPSQGASSFALRLLSTGILITGCVYLPNPQSKLAASVIAGSIGAIAHTRSRDESLALAARELIETETLEGLQLQLEAQFKPSPKLLQGEIIEALPTVGEPLPIFDGDVIGKIAGFKTHLLIATKTGAGKSTLLKAVLLLLLQLHPDASLSIIDPKTTDWLGLQRTSNAVLYLSGNEDTQLNALANKVDQTFAELQRRKMAKQQALINRQSPPKFTPHYLLIDEWFTLFDKLKRYKDKELFNKVIGQLNEIVAQGRELLCHLILVGQSHLCGEIGFSTNMRRSFEYLCLGANEVGFEPIKSALNDFNLFSDKEERERLLAAFNDVKSRAGNNRIVLCAIGSPAIAMLPDLASVHGQELTLKNELAPAKTENDLIIEAIKAGWSNTKICTELFGVAGGDKFTKLSAKINELREK